MRRIIAQIITVKTQLWIFSTRSYLMDWLKNLVRSIHISPESENNVKKKKKWPEYKLLCFKRNTSQKCNIYMSMHFTLCPTKLLPNILCHPYKRAWQFVLWEVSTEGRVGTHGSMSASIPLITLDPRNDSRVLIGSRIWTFRLCATLFCKMDPGALSVLNHDPKIPHHGNETTWHLVCPLSICFTGGP